MSDELPSSKVMQDKLKDYLECKRWLTLGPLGFQLTKTEKDYLLCLGAYENNPNIKIGQTALRKVFGDSAPAVSTTLGRMKKEGLVELTACEGNKRKVEINLTESGRRAYEGLCRYLQSNIERNPIDAPDQGPDIGFFGM